MIHCMIDNAKEFEWVYFYKEIDRLILKVP